MTPQTAFGRRNIAPALRASPGASGVDLRVELTPEQRAAILTGVEGQARSSEPPIAAAGGGVPWSRRAAYLACIAASCLSAAVALETQRRGGETTSFLAQAFGPGAIGAPLRLLLELLSAAADALTCVWATRKILNAFGLSDPLAYLCGGALIAVGLAYLCALVGLGQSESFDLAEAATGGGAAFFYRRLAGSRI